MVASCLQVQPQTSSCGSFSQSSHPLDKEIALLAFEHWKTEGCPHLRMEHWLSAEKQLMEAYAQKFFLVFAECSDLDESGETETVSGLVNDHETNPATKGHL